MASWADVIRRLASQRANLQAELQRIDALMQSVQELQRIMPDQPAPDFIDQQASTAREVVASPGLLQSSLQEPIVEPTLPRSGTRERNIVPPDDVARFARETLIAEGRPLKRGRLLAAIQKRGLPLAGSDPAKNLGTILWRHKDEFVNIEHLGYWPRDVALPNVYDPNDPPKS